MNDLQKRDEQLPVILPDPTSISVTAALDALHEALNVGVEIAKISEIGKTERALILADKEVKLTQISEDIKRGMANDRLRHEEKMSLIQYVGDLLTGNANALTPEAISIAQVLLQMLREL